MLDNDLGARVRLYLDCGEEQRVCAMQRLLTSPEREGFTLFSKCKQNNQCLLVATFRQNWGASLPLSIELEGLY